MITMTLKFFGWLMFWTNVGGAVGSAIHGDILWTLAHAALAGILYWQLRTYTWLG